MKRFYGQTADNKKVEEYTLTNRSGMEVKLLDYGGILTSIRVPDRYGTLANVSLGFDNLADYESKSPYFGSIIGRYGNRIAKGKFTLKGKDYSLVLNDGGNTLHGGLKGFDKVVWDAKEESRDGSQGIVLSRISADGEEGFPGNLELRISYFLTDANEIRIEYYARTDATTVVNLTNHAYFNLQGEGAGSIDGHILMIDADAYTPVDAGLIPTGELAEVEGSPFDFRVPKNIGYGLRTRHEQIALARGYDHNFVINRPAADKSLKLVARVYEPISGRILEVITTEPGIQFYSGNFIDGSLIGSCGRHYRQGDAFALETQHFPDSPNKPQFPSTVLEPEMVYESTTIYKFDCR
jgi:aldose 1-epimerase